MIGILLVTHATLGDSLLECAKHIMGPDVPAIATLAVCRSDDPQATQEHAQFLVEQLDQGSGVLILTDIFGGTPSNVACRLVVPGKIEAIAGVSLPMLVRALTYRSQGLEVVVSKAITGGLEGVRYVLPGEYGAAA
ncbi:MAG: PTS fructose transporter subunit IIA [Chitinivorax sp.]|jgi:PTS system mannose-specific IIA component|nr:MAG: PTS fructose transporter subunit IIA [Neisseriaceae bacterium]